MAAFLDNARNMPLGLRLCSAFFGTVFVLCVIQSALMDPADFVYDISMLRAILFMGAAARSLWLIHTRSSHARPYIIAITVTLIALTLADLFGGDAFVDVAARIGIPGARMLTSAGLGCETLVIAYLALSRRAREYCSVPVDSTPAHEGGNSWDEPLTSRLRTWEFWRDLAIYFIAFSILGHWAEILFCRLILLGVFMGGYDPTNVMLWEQWLYPFSAEGMALAMVVLLLHPVKERLMARFGGRTLPALLASFLLNMAVCTAIDFGTGMVANQNYELWDYRDMPFNFMGQVCLQNSLVYSVAATIIVWVVYPIMDRAIRRLPSHAADGLFFGMAGMYAFLAALHFVKWGA